jgi:hypothetical protein
VTVTLTNLKPRLRAFVLPHESYCAALGRCACVLLPGRAARRVPSSITLAASAAVEGLAEAVLSVPEIARAVRGGELRANPVRAVNHNEVRRA